MTPITITVNGTDYVPRIQMPRYCGERSGDYLRRLRVRRVWTIKHVADAIGCCSSTVSDAEAGVRLPGVPMLCAMATLYGVTLDEIVRADR